MSVIYSVADCKKLKADKEGTTIPGVKGILTAIQPGKDFGKLYVQKGTLQDFNSRTTITVKFVNRDGDVDKSLLGRVVYITSYSGGRGMSGVKVKLDEYTPRSGGRAISETILWVTKTGDISDVPPEGFEEGDEQPPQEEAAPPARTESRRPAPPPPPPPPPAKAVSGPKPDKDLVARKNYKEGKRLLASFGAAYTLALKASRKAWATAFPEIHVEDAYAEMLPNIQAGAATMMIRLEHVNGYGLFPHNPEEVQAQIDAIAKTQTAKDKVQTVATPPPPKPPIAPPPPDDPPGDSDEDDVPF